MYDIHFDYVNPVIEKKKYKYINNLNIAVIAVRVFIDRTTPIFIISLYKWTKMHLRYEFRYNSFIYIQTSRAMIQLTIANNISAYYVNSTGNYTTDVKTLIQIDLVLCYLYIIIILFLYFCDILNENFPLDVSDSVFFP